MQVYYGLLHPGLLWHYAKAVCDVLGHGKFKNAVLMVLETIAAESQYCSFRDTTDYAAGMGPSQVDEGTFDWLKVKFTEPGRDERDQLLAAFDIDIEKVEWRELEHNPLLACIFCRLRYRVVAEPIPNSPGARAAYWKKHYNGAGPNGGKGTVEHYINSVNEHRSWMNERAVLQMAENL